MEVNLQAFDPPSEPVHLSPSRSAWRASHSGRGSTGRTRSWPIGRAALAALVVVLGLLASGCETASDYSVTYKLWKRNGPDDFNGPALDSRLAVYEDPRRADVLVTYDERTQRDDQSRRRAFYL